MALHSVVGHRPGFLPVHLSALHVDVGGARLNQLQRRGGGYNL